MNSYTGVTTKANGLAIPAEVCIKASYKHLASVYFKDRFNWKPADETTVTSSAVSAERMQADGRIHTVFDGFGASATAIFLSIIHGRANSDRVRKKIDLEALAQISLAVDRLKVQGSVQIYTDRWLRELHDTLA